MPMRHVIWLAFALIYMVFATIAARAEGAAAECVGGTVAGLDAGRGQIITTDETFLEFRRKAKEVYVGYEKINLLECGQSVDRRYVMAVIVSPLFLLSKKKQHFLTVGYTDENGKQQALVFKVDKNMIRSVLVSLEARTGLKVQFQDNEARKAGKG